MFLLPDLNHALALGNVFEVYTNLVLLTLEPVNLTEAVRFLLTIVTPLLRSSRRVRMVNLPSSAVPGEDRIPNKGHLDPGGASAGPSSTLLLVISITQMQVVYREHAYRYLINLIDRSGLGFKGVDTLCYHLVDVLSFDNPERL